MDSSPTHYAVRKPDKGAPRLLVIIIWILNINTIILVSTCRVGCVTLTHGQTAVSAAPEGAFKVRDRAFGPDGGGGDMVSSSSSSLESWSLSLSSSRWSSSPTIRHLAVSAARLARPVAHQTFVLQDHHRHHHHFRRCDDDHHIFSITWRYRSEVGKWLTDWLSKR